MPLPLLARTHGFHLFLTARSNWASESSGDEWVPLRIKGGVAERTADGLHEPLRLYGRGSHVRAHRKLRAGAVIYFGAYVGVGERIALWPFSLPF